MIFTRKLCKEFVIRINFYLDIFIRLVEETKPEADEVHVPLGPISKKLAKLGQEAGGTRREGGGGRTRRKLEVVREKGPQGLMISEEQARAIFSAYEPLDAGVEKEEPLAPIV